jgi:hypothetical protein
MGELKPGTRREQGACSSKEMGAERPSDRRRRTVAAEAHPDDHARHLVAAELGWGTRPWKAGAARKELETGHTADELEEASAGERRGEPGASAGQEPGSRRAMGDGRAAEERDVEAPSCARASWGGERRERLGKGLASANRVPGERERCAREEDRARGAAGRIGTAEKSEEKNGGEKNLKRGSWKKYTGREIYEDIFYFLISFFIEIHRYFWIQIFSDKMGQITTIWVDGTCGTV